MYLPNTTAVWGYIFIWTRQGQPSGRFLIFNLLFPHCLLLIGLDTIRSIPSASEDLIGHVEDAPTLDLGRPQFN